MQKKSCISLFSIATKDGNPLGLQHSIPQLDVVTTDLDIVNVPNTATATHSCSLNN